MGKKKETSKKVVDDEAVNAAKLVLKQKKRQDRQLKYQALKTKYQEQGNAAKDLADKLEGTLKFYRLVDPADASTLERQTRMLILLPSHGKKLTLSRYSGRLVWFLLPMELDLNISSNSGTLTDYLLIPTVAWGRQIPLEKIYENQQVLPKDHLRFIDEFGKFISMAPFPRLSAVARTVVSYETSYFRSQ